MLGEAIWSLKCQYQSVEVAKKAILAVFWTFLKGPSVEFAQNALKCTFFHARFTGLIGSDASFCRGLARRKTCSARGRSGNTAPAGVEYTGTAC